jgi:hypothetical protein
MLDPDPNERAATRGDDADVSEAPASVETGFDDLGATIAPAQPAAPTVNPLADTGEPKDAGADLNARVAALLLDKPATDWNAVSAFMANVVAWPASLQDPGYVNLHYSYPSREDPKVLEKKGGWPKKDITSFMGSVSYALRSPSRYKDIWYCTSMQSQTKPGRNGKPIAHRLKANAMSLKAIWIDADVDDDPKHYHSIAEALKALLEFQVKVGLPPPSAIVFSGGGVHMYWINRDPLTPAEWHSCADGLKQLLLANNILADSSITTDSSRILRVPGTLNYKYDPPRPVTLAPGPLIVYDFPTRLAFLQQFAGPTIAAPPLWADDPSVPPGARDSFKAGMAAAFASQLPTGEPGLEAGIDKFEDHKLDPFPIFKNCGFYRDALLKGGADNDQPQWNLAILGTTFMAKGSEIAHKISSGHSTYTEADTEAMYDRKAKEQSASGIGYPSCAAIAGTSCEACKTCPHLSKGKSPLHLRIPEATENPSDAGETTTGPTASPPPELKFSLSDIPPHRPWLYGVDLVRGDLSVLASTGGAGKTSLAVGMAISLASGNSLLGAQIWGSGPLTSLYINAEDSGIEMRRRALAFCQQHNITVLDRLYIAGTDDLRVRGLSFLRPAGQNSSVLDQAGLENLDNLLASLRPDLVVIDPLIALCGGGNVNDNAAMALVMREIKRLAIKFNCSILIVHHTRKGGEPGSAEAISGASAIKDLARCARMPVTMTTAEMGVFHVLPSERLQHFKLVDAKSNLALHSDETWYKLESQELPNAGAPYPHGDRVQAVVRVQLSVQPGGSANADDMKIEAAILHVVDCGKVVNGQAYPYSPSLAGAKNERALLPDAMVAVASASAPRQWVPGDLEAAIKTAVNRMLTDGRLVTKDVQDLMAKPGRFRKGRGLKTVPI